MRLTKQVLKDIALPPGRSEGIYFDDTLPGFGLRLRASGKRTWIAQYRVGSRQRRITLGTWETLTPEEARRHARDVLAKVHLGQDPQLEKKTARAKSTETIGAAINQFLSDYAEPNYRPKTLAEVKRALLTAWKPLHELPFDKISRALIAERLSELRKTSGPVAANRARSYLSTFFSWALQMGLTETSPLIGTSKGTREEARDRVLSDEELADIWRHTGNSDYGTIVRLLMLTGQRREEVGGMLWSELNLEKKLWTIPKERTKNKLAHDVPLTDTAITLLAERVIAPDRGHVFGRLDSPFSGWSKAKLALDARIAADRKKDGRNPMLAWRLHDLRRTAATRMADLGVQPHVIEAVLNHISGHRSGVAGIYNRATYAAEKRAALDLLGSHIGRISNDS